MSTHRFFYCTISSLVFFLMLLVISQDASAASYRGRWFCQNCSLDQYGAVFAGDPLQPDTDALLFLKSDVNPHAPPWQPGDTIDVCDGIFCLNMVWLANGNWYFNKLKRDKGGKYQNSMTGGTTTSDSSVGSYDIAAYGHWEWWDFYSNGVYTDSSAPEWVWDSISVRVNGAWLQHYLVSMQKT